KQIVATENGAGRGSDKVQRFRRFGKMAVMLPSPGTPGEGPGVRAAQSVAECSALTPNPSPGVPGEGSNLESLPRPLLVLERLAMGVLQAVQFFLQRIRGRRRKVLRRMTQIMPRWQRDARFGVP